ncbi:hypothetical protein ACH4ZX_03625 [Streptomyces sp. NPDC020490]|uniref:hypothetical protein n=1 Tax=Streptomyces sp. NPDC020490 TaxID=3365078 RepID=UPI00379A58D8
MKLASRFFRGPGRHRLTDRPAARIEVPLDHLLGPRFADVPHGAIAPQGFRNCPPCGGEVPVVLHPGGAHTCEAGHLVLPGGAR